MITAWFAMWGARAPAEVTPAIREFDALITAIDPAAGTLTVHHNATQFTVVLRTDQGTAYHRIREAPFDAFPSGKPMRFWGTVDLAQSTMLVQGLRRSAEDDQLKPEITPTQNYVGGRLVRENGKVYIEAGAKRLTVTVDPYNFEGCFEEEGAAADCQPNREVHVRYQEEATDGRALAVHAFTKLPHKVRQALPASGATADGVRQTFAEVRKLHEKLAPELARLMPVRMVITPELANVGEGITVRMEALATQVPNRTLELYPAFLVSGVEGSQALNLDWKTAGSRHGLTIYQADCRLPCAKPGNYVLHWQCDCGGDISDFWRSFAVIDKSWAVCLFLSTSHSGPRPGPELHRWHIPYEEWIGQPLELGTVLQGNPQTWAGWSRESRAFGMQVNPHLYGAYWVRDAAAGQANLQAETPELQKAVLAGYREMLAWLGFGPVAVVSAYTMDTAFSRVAREVGYSAMSSLCPGQNFMDGPMRINHFGMPDRPYFISPEDFRKPGPGGRGGLVGISQCQRSTFLNREFNCTYCLEPAWNEQLNEGAGRSVVDDIWNSRMYDFFDAMLQNRLSQATPYVFNVGIEFNGLFPGITEGNRLLIEYAAKKARTEPLVFSTGPAVAEYYRRHFSETPETTCYQQDYFGGLTKLDKFVGYPDTLEIEGPEFQSLLRAPDILPAYHYDYRQPWQYPAWGNEALPRNKWGYLYPGQHDRFSVTPRIVDTRRLAATRTDAWRDGKLFVTVTVRARAAQKNLALALWDMGCEWRSGSGWWRTQGQARFVPVRAPFTGNLNGLLVADVKEGENQFTVTALTPPRKPTRSTVRLGGGTVEGRVYKRDGQFMAYLWPTRPWSATLTVNLPAGKQADAYIAPQGPRQALRPGENRFDIPAGKWMRIIGLAAEELEGPPLN